MWSQVGSISLICFVREKFIFMATFYSAYKVQSADVVQIALNPLYLSESAKFDIIKPKHISNIYLVKLPDLNLII